MQHIQVPEYIKTYDLASKNIYQRYLQEQIQDAEIAEFLKKELKSASYCGCTIRRSQKQIEITVRCAQAEVVEGPNHERVHQLESIIAIRLNTKPEYVTIYCDQVASRGLSAEILADALAEKIQNQVQVRQAAIYVMRQAMRSLQAQARDSKMVGGVTVRVAGKLRQQRANQSKYGQGVMLTSGTVGKEFVDRAVRHVYMKQGIIGVEVKIFNPRTRDQFGRIMTIPDDIQVAGDDNKK